MEWLGQGWGGSQERRGERHWVWGSRLSPPNTGFVELEVMSDRAGGQGLQDWSGKEPGGGLAQLSLPLSLKLFHWKSAPCTSTPLSRAGGADLALEATSAAGLAQVCLLPLRERKKGHSRVSRSRVPPQGQCELWEWNAGRWTPCWRRPAPEAATLSETKVGVLGRAGG